MDRKFWEFCENPLCGKFSLFENWKQFEGKQFLMDGSIGFLLFYLSGYLMLREISIPYYKALFQSLPALAACRSKAPASRQHRVTCTGTCRAG